MKRHAELALNLLMVACTTVWLYLAVLGNRSAVHELRDEIEANRAMMENVLAELSRK